MSIKKIVEKDEKVDVDGINTLIEGIHTLITHK